MQQAASQSPIRIINVSKRYGEHDVQALHDVSLDIPRAKFIAIMGPSGCGKSTLLNCIGGIDRPDTGQIIIEGDDIATFDDQKMTALRRDKIGFVFQFFNLLSTLTVRENVQLPLDLAGAGRAQTRAAAEKLLAQVGLMERSEFYPSQLSGGEMQRVAVLRAIIHNPLVILADEPTGNLDSVNGENVLRMLKELCSNGQTVLMATHSPEAAEFADVVIHMRDGAVVESSLP